MSTESILTRTEIILTDDELNRLRDKHVFVAGIGGVGSFVAEALGRTGVRRITLLDHDNVAPSNLNRQIIALESTLGQNKAEVMAARLKDINPDIEVTILTDFMYRDDAAEFVASGKYDYIIDCIDSISSKVALVAACRRSGVPIASSMGAGNRLDVTQVRIAKLNKTVNCPLAREMRSNLRKQKIDLRYPVVYSQEVPTRKALPHAPVEGGRPRAVNGTISYMPALFGMMLAGYVINELISTVEEKE